MTDSSRELPDDHPIAVDLAQTIRAGDAVGLRRLLAADAELATVRIVTPTLEARSLLHVAVDWPPPHPNAAQLIKLLAGCGADVNARFRGAHTETALHWAASGDDVEALDALVRAGADLEADGAVIAGGTPLDDAVAFGSWRAARRLVEHGARTALWHAAALDLQDRVHRHFTGEPLPAAHPWGRNFAGQAHADERDVALWCAGHGGSAACAHHLIERGANPRWSASWDNTTPIDAARNAGHTQLADWLETQPAQPS